MNLTSELSLQVDINGTCTDVAGTAIGFTTTGPGTVVLEASVNVNINHAAGADDAAKLNIGNTTSDCASAPAWAQVISDPAGAYTITVSLVNSFTITSAGSHTFYLDAINTSAYNGDAQSVSWITVVGTFYPS